MGRLSGINASQALARVVRPVGFVKLAFPSYTFRFHTWPGLSLAISTETYTGDPSLSLVGAVNERADGKVANISLSFSVANTRLREAFDNDAWHFSLVTLYEGYLKEDLTLYDTPYCFGSYYMSSGERSTEDGVIQLSCEPVSIRLQRRSLMTSSNADQQARYSGDTFFKYSASMVDKELAWGGSVGIIRGPGASLGAGGLGGGQVTLFQGAEFNETITP